MNGAFVHQMLECSMKSTAFQADDEGSIPFTRSNVFNRLRHVTLAVLTSRPLVVLTFVRQPFA
jgi:hypothetical protein